jgi:Fe-S protein assembly co-chaperone HscB
MAAAGTDPPTEPPPQSKGEFARSTHHAAQDDPFAGLDLPQRFTVDPVAVDRAWRRGAARLHPDRFSDPVEQREAVRAASILNAARETLLDPLRRAEALLALRGGPAAADERGLPPEFLPQMLEIRERLAEADLAADAAARREIEAWCARERDDRIARVAALLDGGAAASGEAEPLRQVRLEINVWRYLERLREELRTAVP